MSTKTMTLNLGEPQMEALGKMAKAKELSKTALIRQALGLYQLVDAELCQGCKLAFIDKEGKVHRGIVVGMGMMAPCGAESGA